MVDEGTLIAGRYRLLSPIGDGGMGEVWQAEDETLRRSVAIKVLHVRPGKDANAMTERFLREARLAAAVQHRNVVQTVDFGIHEGGTPFMVMELLDGETLEDRMERVPPLAMSETVHVISLTLRGLAAVHDAGIVHRDMKPANVFLMPDGESLFPKILDFGISRNAEGDSAVTTREGRIIGTPDFMSPEQARGEDDLDARSDLFAVGAILYQALAGSLPYEGRNPLEVVLKIGNEPAKPIQEAAPDLHPALANFVTKALARDREERFPDAREMRRALLQALEASESPDSRRTQSDVPPGMHMGSDAPLQFGGGDVSLPPTARIPEEAVPTPAPMPVAAAAPSFGGGLDPFDAEGKSGITRAAALVDSTGSMMLPGDPMANPDEVTGVSRLPDFGDSTGLARVRENKEPRRTERVRMARPRRRPSRGSRLVLAGLILVLLYAPRWLLNRSSAVESHEAPVSSVRAADGSGFLVERRSGLADVAPPLRDLKF